MDKLTLIAHENFEEVLKRAQDPNSLLHKVSFVELDDEDAELETGKVIVGKTFIQQKFEAEKEKAEQQYKKTWLKQYLIKRAVWQAIPKLNTEVSNKVKELSKSENVEKLRAITEEIIARRYGD